MRARNAKALANVRDWERELHEARCASIRAENALAQARQRESRAEEALDSERKRVAAGQGS